MLTKVDIRDQAGNLLRTEHVHCVPTMRTEFITTAEGATHQAKVISVRFFPEIRVEKGETATVITENIKP